MDKKARQGDWIGSASCAKSWIDPEIFFEYNNRLVKDAKQVCETCPVTDQCLSEALTEGYEYGVWGGKTPAERDALRRRGLARKSLSEMRDI